MSSKDKYGRYRKKDFLATIRGVQEFLCEKFGYKIKPYLFETRLADGCMMEFFHNEYGWGIFYDYKQFKDRFWGLDFDVQEAFAAGIIAHEMRHYYQHRQMKAVKPKESEEVIEAWWKDENEMRPFAETGAGREYYLRPMELDAFLFEYIFVAYYFDMLLLHAIANEEHLNAMEKLYMEYWGETDADLFGEEIRKAIALRDAPKAD